MSVKLINEQDLLELDLELLEKVAAEALSLAEGRACRVNVVFMNSDRIQELNRQFLGHDRPTDVLAFPDDDGKKEKSIGDVAVNVEAAITVARRNAWSAQDELALYVTHGILHLVGPYDDTTEAEAEEMHAAEDRVLRKFDIKID